MKKQLPYCPCTSTAADLINSAAADAGGGAKRNRIRTCDIRSLIHFPRCRRRNAIRPSIGCWLALLLPLSSLALVFNDQQDQQDPIFYNAKKKLKEQEIIQKVLRDYDWRVRPRGKNDSWPDTGGPVFVFVNIYLRSISKIDDVNMEYSAQFTFREEWWDPRLAYGRFADDETEVPAFVVLATSEQADLTQQIWMPDTFFQNEKEARRHLIDKPNVLIRIHPDGQILYSVRLSLVLSCPMSLEYYPLDRQTCLIDLASYAYTTDDIKYEWKKEKPIQQKEGLRQSLPSFELQDVMTDYCTSKTNTGEYSCLRTKLILRREFSYYLLQLYIPSCMLVIVSWVSFWLDKDSVPARVTLGVTTLLTMTTQSSGINAKLPPVSYTKAVDVWIGVCMAFIFGALLEFALVNYAARKDISTTQQRMIKLHHQYSSVTHHQSIDASAPADGNLSQSHAFQSLLHPTPTAAQFGPVRHSSTSSHRFVNMQQSPTGPSQRRLGICFRLCCRLFVRRYKERSKRIDVVSRLVFPIGYACFNGEYSCVRVKLFLRREYSYYLIQLYIPCVMLVVVSWVSFWLDKDAVPARVSLGVTTLLTMTTQASGINAKLPPVSYIKAVDVWIGACLAFIFAALLEYALVNYYGRREFMSNEKRGKAGIGRLSMTFQQECLCPPPPNIYHPDFFAPKSPSKSQLLTVPSNNNNNIDSGDTFGGDSHPPLSLENNTFYAGRSGGSSSKRRRRMRQFAVCRAVRRFRQLCGSGVDLSKRVDIVSRVAFPTLYLAFLCFYYVRFVLFQSEEWGAVGKKL